MTDGRLLLEAYLNGEDLTADQRAALSAWVCASPDHARLAAELTHLDATIGALARGHAVGPLIDLEDDAVSSQLLAKLSRLEAEAPVELVHLEMQRQSSAMSRWASWGALAAAVTFAALLGVVLYFTQGGAPSPTDSEPIAATPGPTPAEAPVVATLTAAHEARWGLGKVRVGEGLKAGQTLTLTHGYAEVTTSRGAIAIIEAPATIELSENPNALRLHSGKLVGICETESSKGFVVESRNLRIVDVGTRFGVDARTGVTGVQVEDGEVKVALLYDGHVTGSYQSLTTGTAIEADSSGQIARVAMPREPLIMSIHLLKYKPVIDGDPASYAGHLAASSMPWEESFQAKLFLEQHDFSIPADIATNSSPSSAPNVLTQGTSVDVYLFHIDLPGDVAHKTSHTIHFNRPILGVYTTGQGLIDSDKHFGVDRTEYPQAISPSGVTLIGARGLDFLYESNPVADEIIFSEDRTSLTLNCAAGMYFDQVRIVVQAAQD